MVEGLRSILERRPIEKATEDAIEQTTERTAEFSAALRGDDTLSARQKHVLLDIYATFRHEAADAPTTAAAERNPWSVDHGVAARRHVC